jgi:hypothetical protein
MSLTGFYDSSRNLTGLDDQSIDSSYINNIVVSDSLELDFIPPNRILKTDASSRLAPATISSSDLPNSVLYQNSNAVLGALRVTGLVESGTCSRVVSLDNSGNFMFYNFGAWASNLNDTINAYGSDIADNTDTLTNHETRITDIETINTTQNTRLTNIETINTTQNTRLTNIETLNTTQDTRLTDIETRLNDIESLDAEQDTRKTTENE